MLVITRIASVTLAVLVVTTDSGAATPTAAPRVLCSFAMNRPPGAPALGTPEWAREMVLGAESVVLARVLGGEPPRRGSLWYRRYGTVVLEVRRVLRGVSPPDTFRVPGTLESFDLARRTANDFLDGGGSCHEYAYRHRGLHVLLLWRDRSGELTPYSFPLAPTNREVRGPFDPWLLWVLEVIRSPSSPVGPMRAANDSTLPIFEPWLGWPASHAIVSGAIHDRAGGGVPHARLLAEGFEVAHTNAKGKFVFSWPRGHAARLELQCETPSGALLTHALPPLAARATLRIRHDRVPSPARAPTIPSGVCRGPEAASAPRVIEAAWTAALDSASFTVCRGFPRELGRLTPRLDTAATAELRRRLGPRVPGDTTAIRVRLKGTVEFAFSYAWEWEPPFAFRVSEVIDARRATRAWCQRG